MLMQLAHRVGRIPTALVALLTSLTVTDLPAEPAAELVDVAARIEYGFYTEDQRTIEAARASLRQLGPPTRLAAYYDALGAYRLALLAWRAGGKGVGRWLAECAEKAKAAAAFRQRAPEAHIVQAACALLAVQIEPVGGLLQQRRADKALAQAVAEDPDNPRLALLRAMAINARPGLETVAVDQVRAALSQARDVFRQAEVKLGEPDWGEPETLAHLGESYLIAGDQRRARDLIEEALLIAPDYRFAQELMKEVLSRR